MAAKDKTLPLINGDDIDLRSLSPGLKRGYSGVELRKSFGILDGV